MFAKTARLVLLSLAVALASAPALAQPKKGKPLAEELTGDARTKYTAGAGLYRAGTSA